MAGEVLDFRAECRQLLLALKSTVEVLLGNHTTNVWNTYGGLSRLTNVVSRILNHGLKQDQGCWTFILGLRVLMPTTAPYLERHRLAAATNSDRCYTWIQQRLQEHTLSSYLKVLLDDCNHLQVCYRVGAFLREEEYTAALLTCLKAVENNHLAKLTELDPHLLIDYSTSGPKFAPRSFHTLLCSSDVEPQQHYKPYKLRRGKRLESSKASYYRRRCTDGQQKKSFKTSDDDSFIQESVFIPKSATWSCGLGSSCISDSDRPEIVHQSKSHLTKSKSCINLYSNELEKCEYREWRSSALQKFVIKSLPNDLNTITVNNVPQKISASLEKSLVITGTILDESHRKVLSRAASIDVHLRSQEIDNSLSLSDRGPADSARLERKDIKVVNLQSTYRSPSHIRSRSDAGVVSKTTASVSQKSEAITNCSNHSTIPMSSSLPSNLQNETEEKLDERYSSQTFRRPVKGQSLTSFLSSQDFRTCAEMDRENAHFSICEALISAIEFVKCNQQLKIAEEEDGESDDEEIKHLKQRIRIRRRERIQEKVTYHSPRLLSDGRTDTTTSQTPSPCSLSSDSKSGNTSDSVDPIDLSDGTEGDGKLDTLHESGLSLSLASLYSDADIQRPQEIMQETSVGQESLPKSTSLSENASCRASAESVALSLLKKFSEKQLPKASDLEWLVSEEEAPQKLLPLPTSWPISPDDAEHLTPPLQTRLRGNLEWAPPRQQIIFNVHPPPQRKVIMAKQNYRCAGCGTKVEQSFMKRFRYCEYLGKYFCQCCHNNNLASVPGRILGKWDFNKYYVSNFARHLLERMSKDPLYDISDINPNLYRRVKTLYEVFQYRSQLYHIKDFIRVCRRSENMADILDKQPDHWLNNPHLYSLEELMQVKSGEMINHLKPLVTQSLVHITQCELCQARGFFCEFCKNDKEVIFPFQLGKVIQCSGCWSCYHIDCYVPEKCPKCARIQARKKLLLRDDID